MCVQANTERDEALSRLQDLERGDLAGMVHDFGMQNRDEVSLVTPQWQGLKACSKCGCCRKNCIAPDRIGK